MSTASSKDLLDYMLQLSVLDFRRTTALSKKLANDVDAIVTHMQIDEGLGRFSAQQYGVIAQQPSNEEKARALLKAVWGSKVHATLLRFVYAVYAVCPHTFDEIERGLKDQVCKFIADEVTESGQFLDQCRPVRERLNATLKNLPKKELTLLVVGKTGVGKSTLVNSLLGKSVAKESAGTTRGTSSVKCYEDEFHQKKVRVWDTPGLYDFDMQDIRAADPESQTVRSQRYLEQMKKISSVDLVLFCADAAAATNGADDEPTVEILTKAFTKNMWDHSIIVFTKANLLRSPTLNTEDQEHLQQTVHDLTSRYQDILRRFAGLSSIEAKSVPSLPVGSARDLILADGHPWLPEVWITAAERTRQGANAVFIGWSTARVKAISRQEGDHAVENTIKLSEEQMKRTVRLIGNVELSNNSAFSPNVVKVAAAFVATCYAIGFALVGPFGWVFGALNSLLLSAMFYAFDEAVAFAAIRNTCGAAAFVATCSVIGFGLGGLFECVFGAFSGLLLSGIFYRAVASVTIRNACRAAAFVAICSVIGFVLGGLIGCVFGALSGLFFYRAEASVAIRDACGAAAVVATCSVIGFVRGGRFGCAFGAFSGLFSSAILYRAADFVAICSVCGAPAFVVICSVIGFVLDANRAKNAIDANNTNNTNFTSNTNSTSNTNNTSNANDAFNVSGVNNGQFGIVFGAFSGLFLSAIFYAFYRTVAVVAICSVIGFKLDANDGLFGFVFGAFSGVLLSAMFYAFYGNSLKAKQH